MNIVARARGMILEPAAEWRAVEREATPPREVITGYVLPLAALGAAVVFVVMVIVGLGLTPAFFVSLSGLVSTVVACVIGAMVADGFATTFGGTPNRQQAFKLVGYAFTAVLVANLLPIPVVGSIIRFAALIYSIYVLYLGVTPLMKAPSDKAVPYTLVLIVVMFVAMWLVSMMLGMMLITGSIFTDRPFRIV